MKNENVILEIKQPRFNRNRFRVYYGNIGEIIAQEVLRKQEFEAWLSRPIASAKEFLSLLRFPKIRLDELRRRYTMHSSYFKEKVTWERFLESYRNHVRNETRDS